VSIGQRHRLLYLRPLKPLMQEPSHFRRPYPKNSGVVAANERMPRHLTTVPFPHRSAPPKIVLCERDRVNDRLDVRVTRASIRSISCIERKACASVARDAREHCFNVLWDLALDWQKRWGVAVAISEVQTCLAGLDIKIACNWIC
jgi:hypothetical protein